jgi:serine phosphatase RsbU (regulator of sigma subunit)/anti-sigma regulatory factor (Ser/Thr protein kinase)
MESDTAGYARRASPGLIPGILDSLSEPAETSVEGDLAFRARVRDAVAIIQDERSDLMDALIQTRDYVDALLALAAVSVKSLGRAEGLPVFLDEARILTETDAIYIVDGDVSYSSSRDGGPSEVPATVRERAPGLAERAEWSTDHHRIVALPVGVRTGHTRVIAFARLTPSDPFTTGDLELVDVVVSAAVLSFRLIRLHEEGVRKATLEREHDLASVLAQGVLEISADIFPGFDIYSSAVPAEAAGGDFYFCQGVGDVLWFAFGDVAGKGLPAALVMTRTVSAVRAAMLTVPPGRAGEAMSQVSDELYAYLEGIGLFITMVIGCIDPRQGVIRVANAGHAPVLLCQGREVVAVRAGGPPVGVLRRPTAPTVEFPFGTGDSLVIGSDGLIEQENSRGESFGYSRFIELCADRRGEDLSLWAQDLLSHRDKHSDGHPVSDDSTLLIVRRRQEERTPVSNTSAARFLQLPATALGVRDLGPWLAEAFRSTNDDDLLRRLELAAHEVCMNVVVHAELSPGSVIDVGLVIGQDMVRLTIRDEGPEVDLSKVADPVPGVPQQNGYGLLIVRRLVSELSYRRINTGNLWELRIDRAKTPEESPS